MRSYPPTAWIVRHCAALLSVAALILLGPGLEPAAAAPPAVALPGSNLVVSGAWIREPAPGTDEAAAYLTLRNAGTSAVDLIGVQCAAAAMTMMHESIESGGQSRMRMLEHLRIAPNQRVEFRPGGLHIMLHGLKQPLRPGGRVQLLLLFAHDLKLHVDAVVLPLGSTPPAAPR